MVTGGSDITPSSVPGDFCNLISEDMKDLDMHMSKEHLMSMGTKQYKELVKTKVLAAAFKNLSNIQQTHSKVKNIQYHKLEIQPYLSSPLFSRKEISILFWLRSRSISGIQSDFSELYKPDLACPVCRQHPDTLPGLMTCPALVPLVQKENDSSQIGFSDIFSCDVSKQKAVTQLYVQLLEARDNLLTREELVNTAPIPGS